MSSFTYRVHLFQDDMSDLFACCSLSTFPEKLSDCTPKNEVYTLSRIHRVHVGTCSFWVCYEIEDVSDQCSDVTFQPGPSEHLNEHHVSLFVNKLELHNIFFFQAFLVSFASLFQEPLNVQGVETQRFRYENCTRKWYFSNPISLIFSRVDCKIIV